MAEMYQSNTFEKFSDNAVLYSYYTVDIIHSYFLFCTIKHTKNEWHSKKKKSFLCASANMFVNIQT